MENKPWKWLPACVFMALALSGCGGGGSDVAGPVQPPPSVEPPAVPQGLGKLELLTGKVTADMNDCRNTYGPAAEAEYSRLMRVAVYDDGVYLAESGEGCPNTGVPGSLLPLDVQQSQIRKLSGGVVSLHISMNTRPYFSSSFSTPEMVRFPSGFHRDALTGDFLVLSFAAASSDRNFLLDEQEMARYSAQGAWDYFRPGLFRFTIPSEGWSDASMGVLVAGTHAQPPAYLDGQGNEASFSAPHDLETDASGLFYLIDQGQIRTIDADYRVKTLDLAALGIEGRVLALDADLQGRIHVLTQRPGARFSWYRLADGSRVDYQVGSGAVFEPEILIPMIFTVVGDDLIVGNRPAGGGPTDLYRFFADGTWTKLSGDETPATPQDLLDDPTRYQFPQVQHLEYGPDGNLYIVLQQGVLVARNFK